MNTYPAPIRAAQAIGLTGAAWLSGNIATYSLSAIPALLKSHRDHSTPYSVLVRQWRDMYNAGKAQNPPIAAVTAAAFAFLAWAVPRSPAGSVLASEHAGWLFGVAAGLTVGIVPWTLAVMGGVNKRLMEIAAGESGEKVDLEVGEAGREVEIEGLLVRWMALNAVRGVLPAVGAAVGLLAV
ncbi:hypothetical protein BJX61DRAFT_134372 [Aspergillus egyptiacus]|nr:hypothetical protein BJX61DRAFT_134372 [Aspergillus egyptiacus]